MSQKVLLTDHPWLDVEIEQSILAAAGFALIAGPVDTPDAAFVDAQVAEHDPVAIMTCWAQVSSAAIRSPSSLKIIARLGVGLDNIDVDAATQRGAWVTNVPDYCIEEVSDHAVALVLSLWRGIGALDRDVKAGHWRPAAARLRRTATKTIGIIGYGNTGGMTARKFAQGFGCRVLVSSPSLLREHSPGDPLGCHITVADLQMIQQESDAIVLHAPLTTQTRHMVDDAFFQRLRRKPLLVNVSRGGLIDNDALLRGLEAGLISGAGLDVIEGEPSPPFAITSRTDVVATPHVAFSSDESLVELRQRSATDVVRVLQGREPVYPCNRPVVSD